MAWKINYTETAKNQLKKLDRQIARKILDYFDLQIAQLEDPRSRGKALRSNLSGLWRYRVQDYRLIVEIQNDRLIILILRLGHRRDIY